MQIFKETQRLILRELLPSDDEAMFELDSSHEVHKYLGNNPITTIEQAQEVITFVRQQYLDFGIGRWAVIEKSSGNFIGWSGLKYIQEHESTYSNFYDVGYRLIPKYWGNGYATESAEAAIEYGFTTMNLQEMLASANEANIASKRILEKCGLTYIGKYKWHDIPCDLMKITYDDWEIKNVIKK